MIRRAILGIALCLAMTLSLVPDRAGFAAEGSIVVAQNEGGGFFRRLFGGGRMFQPPPPSQAPRQQLFPGFEIVPPPAAPRQRRQRQQAQQPPPAPVVEKAADAKRAMVIGDFMAGALAKGLVQAYAENPNVVVIDATNGSSGLVRDDFYDWPAKLPSLVEEQKPDAILVMIGANDRQTIRMDSGPLAPGSDAWRDTYAARVAAFADALKATHKPVLWGGLVPVAASVMSRDYSSFNGVFREQAEAKGLAFVDMWNGFADDDGKYVDVGPDVSGQSVQLRGSDGLAFTRAGQRKLAYFVEQKLNDLFGNGTPMVFAPNATLGPKAPDAPQIGPMVPIDALGLADGDTLSASASGDRPGDVATRISARLVDRAAARPPEARVDAYAWPPAAPALPVTGIGSR